MSERTEPLLFSEAPSTRAHSFLPILSGPTAIEPIPRFGDRVFVKRDDRVSTIYGGNKVRRFEYLLAKARDEGARTLVTVGGLASTQVTATVLLGRKFGFDVTAVLFDQPHTDFMRESLAVDLRGGGRLVYAGGYAATALRFVRECRSAFQPFPILPGASSPLANLGYVDAMLELGLQVERGEMPRPDRIVVACGSGGTVAGLLVGARMLGWNTTIVGVRITDLIVSNPATIGVLAHRTARLVGKTPKRSGARFEMDHRFIGPGYGFSTPAAERGAQGITELLGVPGEITYSGKAYAALERQVTEHPKETILFWATLSSVARTPEKRSAPEGTPDALRHFFL